MPTRGLWFVVAALLTAGCASDPFASSAPETPTQPGDMTGRWILTAPNAPSCGLNFGGAPGAQQGIVAAEGGCPGKFFTSRRWKMDQSALTISDQNNQMLARLDFDGAQFAGQATGGMLVTLSR